LPGTDHAAIATQTVVEKKLLKERGKTRYDLGREAFLKEIEKFIRNSKKIIKKQIKKIGSSCDWSRERYTLEKSLTRVVSEIFVQMYKDGLIYRGYRVINWCPRCASTLADDEVEYRETKTKLYTFRYSKDFPFPISTTRPETKLGDTGVAVHPQDKRYQKYIGKTYLVDLGHGYQKIKIIGEKSIDSKFGSGAVGLTPAHSFFDWKIAQKYKLPLIKVIGEDGKMTEEAGRDYQGLEVLEARRKFISWLKKNSLLEKTEIISHNLSVCYRCGTPIEPLPSKQWFIKVDLKFKLRKSKLKGIKRGSLISLKELALKVVDSGEIEIIPKRFKKIYFHWMRNLKDWCISRQIWFGHRIPVWYKGQKIYVGLRCPKEKGWRQDPDTLDTWFSSSLWTFSTLLDKEYRKYKSFKEWLKKSSDLKTYHPISLMETGYDILFFWVARMILMTTYSLGEIPFKKVYLHGLVRDKEGKKMSKSLGNVVDPLEMIKEHGADALRLALIIGTSPGNDIKVFPEKIAGFRNFTNKLWNIARYILGQINREKKASFKTKTLADQWIILRLEEISQKVTHHLEKYEISLAGEKLKDFTWNELADWYLEISKIQLEDKNYQLNTRKILSFILRSILILWHPFMPYVTEAIWKNFIPSFSKKDLLFIQKWPQIRKKKRKKDLQIKENFELFKNVVIKIRNLRAENKLEKGKKIKVIIYGGRKTSFLKKEERLIRELCNLSELIIKREGREPERSATALVKEIEIYLPLKGLVDLRKERLKIKKKIKEVEDYLKLINQRVSNKEFLKKAPQEVIRREILKKNETKKKLKKLKKQLRVLI